MVRFFEINDTIFLTDNDFQNPLDHRTQFIRETQGEPHIDIWWESWEFDEDLRKKKKAYFIIATFPKYPLND